MQENDVVCYSSPTISQPVNNCHSYASLTSMQLDACRICHCEAEPGAPLISPCACSGTLKYVHQSCLQQWIKSANTKSCELCKLDFKMTTSVKPFRKVRCAPSWQVGSKKSSDSCKLLDSSNLHWLVLWVNDKVYYILDSKWLTLV